MNDISACPVGKYGLICREICGHCHNNSECYHGNGTCLEGCKAGFWEHDCKARTFFSISLSTTRVCFLIMLQLNVCSFFVLFFVFCFSLFITITRKRFYSQKKPKVLGDFWLRFFTINYQGTSGFFTFLPHFWNVPLLCLR